MNNVLAASVLALAFLTQPQLPPPFPRPGIEKLFENEHLIVWKGVLGVKGVPTAMHHHERDLVGIFLDAGQVRNTLQDGTVREGSPFIRGAVAFQPRGVTHIEEVLVDGTRAIGVEPKLRDRPPSAPSMATTSDDGRVVVDNEFVLVREYAWLPGVPVRQVFQGAKTVLVGLESGAIAETSPGGTGKPEQVVFGEAALAPGERARVTVAARGTPRMIAVTVR